MARDAKELKTKILEDEFSHLNPMQRQAVFATDAPLLILAGAGSGKTTVIVNKIGYLIKYGHTAENAGTVSDEDYAFLENCLTDRSMRQSERYLSLMRSSPIPADRILAITFTNKAAGEMRSRIEKFGVSAQGIWAMTFHSACVRILRMYADRLGYARNFTIYDDQDSLKLIEAVIKDAGLRSDAYPPRTVRKAISTAKTRFMTPEQLKNDIASEEYSALPKIPEIYAGYEKGLREANAFDFDDLIFETVRLLSENGEVRQKIQNRFDYVLVDEYQDTNPLQYKLVCLLCGGGDICVVGDDDQSIYRFMGADINNILDFEHQFGGTKVIRLEQNYRSTQKILSAANEVIANNVRRKGKNLWTAGADGEMLTYACLPSHFDEGSYIARTVLTEMQAHGLRYNDFCVLYRTHSQSNAIESALRGNGIPYRVYGGLAFYKRKEIQDALAYMNVIVNPNDRTRLSRIINEPKRGIGQTTVDKVFEIASATGEKIFDVMCDAREYPELSRAAEKLVAFTQTIRTLQSEAEEMKVSDFYLSMLKQTRYTEMIGSLEMSEAKTRMDNLQELYNTIVSFEQKAEDEATLQKFLEEQALVSAVDALDENEEAVVLMTMHCAKGLEFDTVFISGFEEGLFPSAQAIGEPDGVEEERRLCYVAMTRAKRKLYITGAQTRMLYGRTNICIPSRFLKEIPDELTEVMHARVPEHKTSAERQRERIQRHREDFVRNTATEKIVPKREKTSVYKKGMQVRHKIFGTGTVTDVLAMTSDTMLTVVFDSVGQKKLMANYAKLEIL